MKLIKIVLLSGLAFTVASYADDTAKDKANKAEKAAQTTAAKDQAKQQMDKKEEKGQWSGSIQFGGSSNTGNSTSYSYSGAAKVLYQRGKWNNNFNAAGQIGGSKSGLTSRNYDFTFQSKYFFKPPTRYIFGLTDLNIDTFSPYFYTWTVSAGYGRRLYSGHNITVDLQAGPGNSRTKQRDTNKVRDEFIILTSGTMNWKLSKLLTFSQNLSYRYGKPNRYLESVTALDSKIMDNLALQLSYTVKHNSYIPSDSNKTKKTDTITAISVVYTF